MEVLRIDYLSIRSILYLERILDKELAYMSVEVMQEYHD